MGTEILLTAEERGIVKGIEKTKIDIFINMINNGIPEDKAKMLAQISDALVEKALGK